jgi:hypothetical protein
MLFMLDPSSAMRSTCKLVFTMTFGCIDKATIFYVVKTEFEGVPKAL